jgi:hypothetical protein
MSYAYDRTDYFDAGFAQALPLLLRHLEYARALLNTVLIHTFVQGH